MKRQRASVNGRKGWLLAFVERASFTQPYNGSVLWPEVIAIVAFDNGDIGEYPLAQVRYEGEPVNE